MNTVRPCFSAMTAVATSWMAAIEVISVWKYGTSSAVIVSRSF